MLHKPSAAAGAGPVSAHMAAVVLITLYDHTSPLLIVSADQVQDKHSPDPSLAFDHFIDTHK